MENVYVRTAADLEKKYRLSELVGVKEAVQMQEKTLTKVNNELNDFVDTTTNDLTAIQEQIDGKFETFYGIGVPALDNYPASGWTTEEYPEHVYDIYYDRETGKTYRFNQNGNEFNWVEQNNPAINEVYAIANSAKDTADNKRRVFVSTPTPPYDSGDIWVKDIGNTAGELYICQIGKTAEQTFDENDFIKATKYTDDTVARQTKDSLEVLSGKVTQEFAANYTKTEIEKIITGTGFNYVPPQESTFLININYYKYIPLYIGDVAQENGNTYVLLVPGTDFEIGDSINDWESDNGYKVFITEEVKITKVQTASATYDEDGMHYEKTGSKTESTINEKGVEVDEINNTNNPYLYAGYVASGDTRFNKVLNGTTLIDFQDNAIVYTKNLVTEGKTIIGTHTNIMDYTDPSTGLEGTGWFTI